MARRQNHGNGRIDESLEAMKQAQTQMLQALANMAQNQTALTARSAETDAEIAMFRRRMDETDRRIDERFSRIEAILTEHSRILTELPERVHRQFGFQPPRPPTG